MHPVLFNSVKVLNSAGFIIVGSLYAPFWKKHPWADPKIVKVTILLYLQLSL